MLAIRSNRPMTPGVFGRDFDRLLQGMFSPATFGYAAQAPAALFPALNLHETEKGYTIEAELPGFTDANIEIDVRGDVLTLKGSREGEINKEGATFHRRERWSGSFERALRLPAEVDAERVSATLINGILTITLPKPEVAAPRKIAIKSA